MSWIARLFIVSFFSFAMYEAGAQTISLDVDVDDLYFTEGGCGDCNSGPDPEWDARFLINGVPTATYSPTQGNIGSCGWRGLNNTAIYGPAVVPSTTVIDAQLGGLESDGFICGGDDANCGGLSTVGTETAINNPPCQWNGYQDFRTCSSDGTTGTWGVEWSYYWYWTALPSGGTITGDQTICEGGDPSILNSSAGTNPNYTIWQWQYQDNCAGGWTDIAGANGATYDPPAGLTNTRCYRRRLRADQPCNVPADQFSNTVTVTVDPLSTDPTAATAATPTICVGGNTDISVVGGSLGAGAGWEWYTGSCGGTPVGSGALINVSPTTTTTYYVRAEGTCNNTACASVTVTVESPSTAPTGASATVTSLCADGTTTDLSVTGGTLGTGANWVWYSASCGGAAEGNGAVLTVTPSATTTYYVRAEGSCNTTACADVTVTAEAPSTIGSVTATPASYCAPGSSTLTITGSLGTGAQWEIYTGGSCGATLDGTDGTGSYVVSPGATTTYYVQGSASSPLGLCPASSCTPVTVTVSSASTDPTGATATSNLVCAGSSTTLSVQGGSLGTGASWEWYSGSCAGVSEGTGASIVVSPTTTTTYYVRAESACGNTLCAQVTIDVEQPSAITSASATPAILCGAGNSDISISGTLGTGSQWEIYSGSCGGTLEASGTTSPITVAVPATTTYYVQASGTTLGACPATSCEIVNVDVNTPSTAPTGATASQTTVCVGGSTQLSVQGGALGTGGSWEWYTGSCGGTPVGTGASINVSPTVNTDYYVRAEDACGVTTCEMVSITVETPSTDPTGAVATTPQFCVGGNTDLTVSGGTLGTGADYVWYESGCGSGASIGTGTTINVSPTVTTTYFVRIEGNCNNTNCQTVTVTVDQESTDPTGVVASQNQICPGQSSVLTVQGGSLGAGANWEWYSGSCGGTPVGSGNTISVSPTSTNTYFVQAVGTCNNTICESITIDVGVGGTAPTSADLTIDNICPGDTTEVFQIGGVLGSGATWVWYTGACGAVTVGVGDTLAVAPTTTTTYYVRAVGTCGATLCEEVTVTVLPGSVAADGITASDNNFCEGNSTTLTVVGGSLEAGSTWEWYENSCGGTPIGSGASVTVTPSTTSTYYVRAEGGTCGNTACQSIFINVLETDAYFVFVDTVCGAEQPFALTGGLPAGGVYSGPGVTNGVFDPSAAGTGTHNVVYSYTAPNGCTASDSTNITVGASTLAGSATVEAAECADGGVTITAVATGGTGDYSYSWSDGSGGNPLQYAQPGTYAVTISDGTGCSVYLDNIVVADDVQCVELPNTFTPNGDGVNETWNIDLTPYGGASALKIFSKWGQVVYEINNITQVQWDGTQNGNELPAGTYYYILELNDATYGTQTGPVSIVR